MCLYAYRPGYLLDLFYAEAAQSVYYRCVVLEAYDCGFYTYRTYATIENVGDVAAELFLHVFGLCGAYVAEGVCARCCEGERELVQQLPCQGMIRAADAYGV